jgi:putative MATE family efflux protein
MRDLTKGRVSGHVLNLACFIALNTVFYTLYFMADLYFVGRLGKEAVAGVALGGGVLMLVLALTQSLGVGPTTLIAQNLGRQDQQQAQFVFNQAMILALLAGVVFGVVGFALRGVYSHWLAADATTADLGVQYLNWFVPAMVLQFPLVAMNAALRAQGDVKVPTAIQIVSVLLNIALAPVLMFGWGTGWPMGVAGAALASFIAIGSVCVAFTLYFLRKSNTLRFDPSQWRPQFRLWGTMLGIGLPAGGEFALISIGLMLAYDIIRPFGSAVQAGFGIGGRIIQALYMPAIAIAIAAAPVAGQNFGAQLGSRVRQTFNSAALMNTAVMLALTLLCQIWPEFMVSFFSNDPAVIAYGAQYLQIISWTFVAAGIVLVGSSLFQGMGNTVPALASSALRLILFVLPAYILSRVGPFELRYVWYISVASVIGELCLCLWLLRREFKRKLPAVDADLFAVTPQVSEPVKAEGVGAA